MLQNPLYIKSLHLVGYKSIRDAEITFQQGLNIIIGKNGGGKTNLLECLNAVVSNRVYVQNFDYDSFSVNFSIDEQSKQFSASKRNNKTVITLDKDVLDIDWTDIRNRVVAEIPEFAFPMSIIFVDKYSSRFIVFNIPNREHISLLKNPFSLVIKQNGTNQLKYSIEYSFLIIKLFLYFLESKIKLENNINNIKTSLPNYFLEFLDKYDLLKNLQKFSPIEDLRISPNINVYTQGFDNEISVQNIYVEFFVNGYWQSWQMLSDGTKRLFYLITEVILTNGVVLLEEPELGVHPHQLHQIMIFLKEQSEAKQIILTTHSPQVLDVLNADELERIIIADISKEQGSQFRHLDEKTIAKAKYYIENEGFISDFWRYSTLEPREVL